MLAVSRGPTGPNQPPTGGPGGRRQVAVVGLFWVLLLLALGPGCDRSPQEPGAPAPTPEQVEQDSARGGGSAPEHASAEIEGEHLGSASPHPECTVPLASEAPPPVASLSSCPADPQGRPQMPLAALRFDAADAAPTLSVELAITSAHQMHGLMFRPTLTDQEGMLFSYPEEKPRKFWMRNTCLALDMIFADEEQVVGGVLEQVTPWNDSIRTVDCPAAHVLEVPAGWVRKYGVKPGMRFSLEGL